MNTIENKNTMTMNECKCTGFSMFPDGYKFRYNENGDICLATDCSTWAKRLVHNVPLSDYIESETFVPPTELRFPEFGTLKKKKVKKESIGNYIEDCEFCEKHMEKTFSFSIIEGDRKLICEECNDFVQKEKCLLCKQRANRYVEFLNEKGTCVPSGKDYCSTCWNNLTQLSNSYFGVPEVEYFEEEDLEACPGCGIDNGGSICIWCRVGL